MFDININNNNLKCLDIINLMNQYANPKLAESWDNIGLMVGDENSYINNILVALDIDDNVISEAIDKNCNLIITHHPFIFKGLKSITTSDITSKRAIKLIQNNINVFSAHTNLDIAKNGTNDTFAKLLKLDNITNLFEPINILDNNPNNNFGLGRIGNFKNEVPLQKVIESIKKILDLNNLVVSIDPSKNINDISIKNIAICTGSGGEPSFIKQAFDKNCDLYITADIKYHNAQYARDLGISLIDATHYASENIIVPVITQYLNDCSNKLNLNIKCFSSNTDGQMFKIY